MGVQILQAVFDARNEWEQKFSQQYSGREQPVRRGLSLHSIIVSLFAWLF